jgi:hypothetical protein
LQRGRRFDLSGELFILLVHIATMKNLPLIPLGYCLAMLVLVSACSKAPTVSLNNTSNSNSGTQPTTTSSKHWYAYTLAGSGQAGFADGDTTQAEFSNAQGIALNQQGNLLLADLGNQRIRMITPSGVVTTWTSDSIANLDTVFGNIFSVEVDSKNDVFVLDYNWIRKFTSSTTSSIFAGQLLVGYVDSIGTYADFNMINQMSIDRQDNLYLPDYDMSNNFHVRKVTPAGVVSTVPFTDNTGIPFIGGNNLWYLYSIAVDTIGNIYVSSGASCAIKKITPQGGVSVFAGSGDPGFFDANGGNALFGGIHGMCFDGAGNLWVCDALNYAIRRVSPDGTVTTILGGQAGYSDGDSAQAKFNLPTAITVDASGTVYVVDNGNNRIRKLVYQ